jgi:hypothetical protein
VRPGGGVGLRCSKSAATTRPRWLSSRPVSTSKGIGGRVGCVGTGSGASSFTSTRFNTSATARAASTTTAGRDTRGWVTFARSSWAAGTGQLDGRSSDRGRPAGASSLTRVGPDGADPHGSGVPPAAQRHPPGEGAAAPAPATGLQLGGRRRPVRTCCKALDAASMARRWDRIESARPRYLGNRSLEARSHSDAWVGSIVCSTTFSSSAVRLSRST